MQTKEGRERPSQKEPGSAGLSSTLARGAEWLALGGFALYAAAAPHSIAVSWVGLSLAALGWIVRLLVTRRTELRRTPLDAPLWLFFGWTILSAIFSAEPRVSLAKLLNASTFLVFYLAQSLLTRRRAVWLAALLIVSGAAGALWGAGEILYGRGVLVRELKADSFLRGATLLQEGDAIWRVGGHRVSTVEEIDAALRVAPAGQRLTLSVISHGEHVEWPDLLVTEEMKRAPTPSGIVGGGRTHSFRASGWTRHYETFAESLQIIAQLALGFALAGFLRRRRQTHRDESRARANGHESRTKNVALSFVASLVLAAGIALTAMRTALVAYVFGASVVAWRTAVRGRARVLLLSTLALVVALGAFVVWQTRAGGALMLHDPSASLRLTVARVATGRIAQHPIFGHGMDSVHAHWNEWGFPGADMLHAHSTPIQIAFDRGLPALLIWLWLIVAFWRMLTRAERRWRDTDEWRTHGLLIGMTGALAGFFVSSLVNYNFGDSEIALLLWWMMGATVAIMREDVSET